ncbi:PmbA protein [Clostridium cavendishii DSM 21758]|uniref:PmbA protein n=1 Tax=Clostridium cavendishii DSM 21758 TaxID=1121302 RepID=A0A1M6E9C1_9CLOT|nr:metallopeptidase TldD-related protein [Clostridium cavendishii]SHI81888.1 PmbA protein [Clostridium cavendishii DSM 21758]
MEFLDFKEALFKKAKEEGLEKYEIYYITKESLEVKSYEVQVEGYALSDSKGLCFRALIDGNMGYSYTEKLDIEAIDILIKGVKDSAKFIKNEDQEFIYGGGSKYETVKAENESLKNLSAEEQIKMVLELEEKTKNYAKEVEKVAECAMETTSGSVTIINSEGLNVSRKYNTAYSYVAPVVLDGTEMVDGFNIVVSNNVLDYDIDKMAKESVEDALIKRGAKPVKSGNYRILLSNEMMAVMLKIFQSAFNSDKVQKGLSLLKGKEGETIASEIVNIVDNPLMNNGPCSTPFDDEGVETKFKYLVKDGVFQTLLYNLKTANKAGVKTTGNASKTSFSSAVEVAATNLYLESGNLNFEELVSLVNDGLYITSLEGTHAGANAVTGDFSLAASGRVIRNGVLCEAVNQITVAGNFFDVLKDIEAIGNDFKFYHSNTASSSVIIKGLAVAGE